MIVIMMSQRGTALHAVADSADMMLRMLLYLIFHHAPIDHAYCLLARPYVLFFRCPFFTIA